MGVAARIFAHLHWLDRADIGQARLYLREALQHDAALPAMSQPSLFLQAAYFESIHDASPRSAREWLARTGEGALVPPHARAMAEGAVLLAEGDARASEYLALAARQLPLAIDRGSARMAADLIGHMQGLLEGPR
jgi:fructose-specific component phosphotransferase system IIB-like protein